MSRALLVIAISASIWLWWDSLGTVDAEMWLGWIRHLMAAGPRQGYVDIQGDYPPGASLVLWIVGLVANHAAIDPRIVLKFTLLVWLLGTIGVLLVASGREGLSAFAYAALVLNSFVLMYLDIFMAPFVLGAIWAARAGREPLMAGLLVCASLMKWQPILVLPFAAIYVLRSRRTSGSISWRRAVIAALMPAGLVLLAIVIYGFPAIHDSLDRAGHHNNLSSYAANPFWVLTWFFELTARAGRQSLSADGLVSIMAASRPVIRISSALSLIGYVVVLRKFWKSRDHTVGGFIRFSLAGYLVYFLLSVGAHENHLFLASLLGIALAWQEPKWLWAAVVLAVAANLNLAVFYGWLGFEIHRVVGGIDVSVICAVAVSIAVGAVGMRLVRNDTQLPRV